jgi:hypothetical protein
MKAVTLLALLLAESCSGAAFTSEQDAAVATGGDSSTGGQMATGGDSSTGGQMATGGDSSTGGQMATGGSSTIPDTTAPDLDACPCPSNAQCKPAGSACNSSDTQLGKVSDKLTCIRSAARCASAGFDVWCFQC